MSGDCVEGSHNEYPLDGKFHKMNIYDVYDYSWTPAHKFLGRIQIKDNENLYNFCRKCFPNHYFFTTKLVDEEKEFAKKLEDYWFPSNLSINKEKRMKIKLTETKISELDIPKTDLKWGIINKNLNIPNVFAAFNSFYLAQEYLKNASKKEDNLQVVEILE